MCLDVLYEKTRTDITHGYKVFRIKNGKIYGELFNPDGTPSYGYHFPYKTDKWYEAGNYIIDENGDIGNVVYLTGFHIFIDEKDAEAWRNFYSENKAEYKILEVEVNNIVASGQQRFDNRKAETIVAKRMKVNDSNDSNDSIEKN